MSESRICPVCENVIPEDARFLCPHCHFELKWLDDEGEIERAKKYLDAEKLIEGSNKPNKVATIILSYIGIAIIIYIVVVIFSENGILMAGHEWTMLFFAFLPCYIGLGLIAGLIFGISNLISRLRKK
jgi:predicted nucleic acid-binding Zn ribbon protein